jgi:hypothetical protein
VIEAKPIADSRQEYSQVEKVCQLDFTTRVKSRLPPNHPLLLFLIILPNPTTNPSTLYLIPVRLNSLIDTRNDKLQIAKRLSQITWRGLVAKSPAQVHKDTICWALGKNYRRKSHALKRIRLTEENAKERLSYTHFWKRTEQRLLTH